MLFASHSSHPDPSLLDTFSDFKVNITQVSIAFFEIGFFRFFFFLSFIDTSSQKACIVQQFSVAKKTTNLNLRKKWRL